MRGALGPLSSLRRSRSTRDTNNKGRESEVVIVLWELRDLVYATLEISNRLQGLRVAKRKELHQDDACDIPVLIDPEIGIGDAGTGETAGAPPSRRSLGVDQESQSPFLHHPWKKFDVARTVGQDAVQRRDVDAADLVLTHHCYCLRSKYLLPIETAAIEEHA